MASITTTHEQQEEEEQRQYAMQIASASLLPMALKAATELCVLEILEKAGPTVQLSSSQIASQLTILNPLLLDCILRLLASNRVLTYSVTSNGHDGQLHSLYGLGPVAKYFIKNHDGGCLAPLLAMIQDKVMMETW